MQQKCIPTSLALIFFLLNPTLASHDGNTLQQFRLFLGGRYCRPTFTIACSVYDTPCNKKTKTPLSPSHSIFYY